ncbi:MAG: hypothetical protein E7E21_03970 [Peptostreptococcaceae bacterium]|nr:hypothetical protein [Peptostreptococcaceae bacterium]
MERSNLQFKNPHINKIDFRVNDYEPDTDNMPISIEVECEINPIGKEAIVTLDLCVGKINKNNKIITSFYFNGEISADFLWNEEIENPEKMLKVSGGTVLLSYIRPILANLTMQAGMKPLNLPFINFTK